jgi:hypothetical protein
MLDTLRRRIDALMTDGMTLNQVEDEVIQPSPLSDEQKSALWLYARILHPPRDAGRSEALSTRLRAGSHPGV